MDDLEILGYDHSFVERADAEMLSQHDLARVTAVQRDSFIVTRGGSGIFAEASGNLLYATDSPLELPTVGDWVYVDLFDEGNHAIIHGVVGRKSLLKRKTAGKRIDIQLIAANIDVALIIQSLNENLNLRRLERYLVMVNDSGIEPVILLSKTDLMEPEVITQIEESLHTIAPAARILSFSNLDRDSVASITSLLLPGKTYCLLGSSGVGKTTLLNSIIGDEAFETREVSRIQSKGRHTTTSRQLVRLENGAMIIDTPGMRELGNLSIGDGLDDTFDDISDLTRHCRFSNCTHSNEQGCAILAAIGSGELDEGRFQNYLKLKREDTFNSMSYAERRKKDKDFGKMVKAVMKEKQR